METTLAARAAPPLPSDGLKIYLNPFSTVNLARLMLWVMFLTGFAVVMVISKGSMVGIVMAVAFTLAPAILFEVYLSQRLPWRKPILTLDANGIWAPGFPRKRQRLQWSELAAVAMRHENGFAVIELQPRDQPPARFLSVRTSANPYTIHFAWMKAADQPQVEEWVKQHVVAAGGQVVDSLTEVRAVEQQVKALAPHTWATYALIGINLAIWFAMIGQGAPFDHIGAAMLLDWGGNLAPSTMAGEWWRLATAMFLHGGFKHIVYNMLALYVVGKMVERLYGAGPFLLIYGVAGLAGNALSLSFAASHAVSVGASGAIFGVAGALLVTALRDRAVMPDTLRKQLKVDALVMIGYSLVQGVFVPNIDNAAHVGGLVAGALVAIFLAVRLDEAAYQRSRTQGVALGAMVGLLAVVNMIYLMPAARQQVAANTATRSQQTAQPPAPAAQPVPHLAPEERGAEAQLDQAYETLGKILMAERGDAEAEDAGKLDRATYETRVRTVHLPAHEQMVSQLVRITLPAAHPRAAELQDLTLTVDVLTRLLKLELDPQRDDARVEQLDAERERLFARMSQHRSVKKRG